jgi:hypothetical protein
MFMIASASGKVYQESTDMFEGVVRVLITAVRKKLTEQMVFVYNGNNHPTPSALGRSRSRDR